jgi:hypothetical protein
MPARSTSTSTIRGANIGALALALIALFQIPAAAQDRSQVPTEVRVVGEGTSATVTWTGVASEGVTYRVLRQGDADRSAIDITRPVSGTSAVDTKVVAGLTYSYQVMAVFRDGTSTSSELVKYSAPAAPAPAPAPVPLTVVTQPPLLTATAVPLFATAVTGISITGTTASAQVSWSPASMATSYAIKRTMPNSAAPTQPVSGITGTSWNDPGPGGVGFTKAGVYTYEVVASLSNGTTVSGQATWTRPAPTCAAPPASQQMLTILTPSQATVIGPYPGIAGFTWVANSAVIAHRMERSVQGSGTWTEAGTSCDGAIGFSSPYYDYLDRTAGTVAPNTAYIYKLTAIAATGETGVRELNWTSPNAAVIHWLSAVVSGNSVTLNFRYEAPATNPPRAPSERFHVTSDYGLDQVISSGSYCSSLAGCTLVVNGVPSGSHVFTATAAWGASRTAPITTMSANNTVIIP